MNIQDLEIEANNIKNDFLLSSDVKEIRINILNLMYYYYQSESEYNALYNNFLSLAPELVNLSSGMYQLEESIKLNKISIKGYILESEFVLDLNRVNITEFSLEELKEYVIQYSSSMNKRLDDISLGIKLYEMLENLDDIKNGEIKYLINGLEEIFNQKLSDLDLLERSLLNNLYSQLISETNVMFNKQVLDNKIRGYLVSIINFVFGFYMN